MRVVGVVGALLLASGVVLAAEALKSGLQVGESCPAFQVFDITGPNQGKQLCYVWANGNSPSILIFGRNLDGNLTRLVKSADKFISTHKGMKGFVVVVGEREKLQDQVKELAAKEKLAIPLTFFADGPTGSTAQRYKLNPQVANTVLVYTNKKVTANFALQQVQPDDVKAVVAEAAKIAPRGAEGT